MAFEPGTPDYYKDLLDKAQVLLDGLIAGRTVSINRNADWANSCKNGCSAAAQKIVTDTAQEIVVANAAIDAQVAKIVDLQKLYDISVTEAGIQANKSLEQIAAEQAAAAKQKNYRIALIAGIAIVVVIVAIVLIRKYRK